MRSVTYLGANVSWQSIGVGFHMGMLWYTTEYGLLRTIEPWHLSSSRTTQWFFFFFFFHHGIISELITSNRHSLLINKVIAQGCSQDSINAITMDI